MPFEAKTSGSYTTDNLLKWVGSKYADAGVKTSTTLDATKDTEVPTSKAVGTAITNATSGFVSGSSMTSGQIVLAKGAQEVETTGLTVLKATDSTPATSFVTSDDANIPTVGAVTEYVEDGLAALNTAIGTFNTSLQ